MFYKKSYWLKNAYMQSSIQADESWIEMSDDLFQQDLSLGDFYLKTFLANPDDCYLTYHKLYNLQQQQMQLQKYLNDTDYIITKLNELKLTETEEDFNQIKKQYSETLTKRSESRKQLSSIEEEIKTTQEAFEALNNQEED